MVNILQSLTNKYYSLRQNGIIETAVILIFAAGILLGFLQVLSYFIFTTPFGIDFTAYYISGKMLNQYNLLYDPSIEANLQGQLKSQGVSNVSDFIYPPSSAMIFRLLALLPWSDAFAIWSLLNIIALILLCLVIRSIVSKEYGFGSWWIIIALVFFQGIPLSIVGGQIMIWLTVFVSIAYLLMRNRDRSGTIFEMLTGACLACATLMKISPILLMVPFIVKKRFRVVYGWLVGIIALFFMSIFLAGGLDSWTQYASRLRSIPPYYQPTNQSLESLFWRSFYGTSYVSAGSSRSLDPIVHIDIDVRLLSTVSVLTLIFLTLYATLRQPLERQFLALIVPAIIGLPLAWAHTHILILLPLGVAAGDAFQRKNQRELLICAILYFFYQIQKFLTGLGAPVLWQSMDVYAALGVGLLCIYQGYRARPDAGNGYR